MAADEPPGNSPPEPLPAHYPPPPPIDPSQQPQPHYPPPPSGEPHQPPGAYYPGPYPPSSYPMSANYNAQPVYLQQQVIVGSNGAATWSLVFGILSWFLCPFLGALIAIILGHAALSEIKRHPGMRGSGQAAVGLVLGYLHIAIYGGIVLLIVLGVCGSLAAVGTQSH